ncbi:hypothetical protein [uncultured Dokdonia sp.]|uniref:hypothetical protein n=1 Tax=uncultured Dokdonia sp. TaxID=575653 RepID=UPI0030ED29D3|tara:strand:+ start:41600 stop:41941 length:342 start_codon:yes stop_codon:yes gene_type:complete
MKKHEQLKSILPDGLNYTVASSDTYIFSQVYIKIGFEFFIREDGLSIKYPKGNLSVEKINAISTLLEDNKVGDFKHRTYGSNSTTWSIWDLQIKINSKEHLVSLVDKLKDMIV